MGDVIDINDRRLGWLNFRARCKACGHRWIGVAREDTDLKRLECPGCAGEESFTAGMDEAGHAL